MPDNYLSAHSKNRAALIRQIQAFELYRPLLSGGTVLDWGCKHAVDACLLKMTFDDTVELHGCDVGPVPYKVFHEFANLHYEILDHPYQLPYPKEKFDAVIASGVLEHVPDNGESLRELYRILKPNGILAITFLPNRWSYTEFINRCIFRSRYHKRRYKGIFGGKDGLSPVISHIVLSCIWICVEAK